jgi:hypothetical protein
MIILPEAANKLPVMSGEFRFMASLSQEGRNPKTIDPSQRRQTNSRCE